MLSYISNIIMQIFFITYIYICFFFFYFASFIVFAIITHERLIKDVNMMSSEMITPRFIQICIN